MTAPAVDVRTDVALLETWHARHDDDTDQAYVYAMQVAPPFTVGITTDQPADKGSTHEQVR